MNHEEYTQGEYGPNTGIWRILRILSSHEVKATFLTCGGIAERYPEAVAAIVAQAMKSPVMVIIMKWRGI